MDYFQKGRSYYFLKSATPVEYVFEGNEPIPPLFDLGWVLGEPFVFSPVNQKKSRIVVYGRGWTRRHFFTARDLRQAIVSRALRKYTKALPTPIDTTFPHSFPSSLFDRYYREELERCRDRHALPDYVLYVFRNFSIEWADRLSQLEQIRTVDNLLDGVAVVRLLKNSPYHRLVITNAVIEPTFLSALKKLTHVHELFFHMSDLRGIEGSDLEQLDQLKMLSLCECRLPEELSFHSPELRLLDLSATDLPSVALEDLITRHTSLQHADVSMTSIKAEQIRVIARKPLENLILDYCDECSIPLGDLSRLKFVSLRGCRHPLSNLLAFQESFPETTLVF